MAATAETFHLFASGTGKFRLRATYFCPWRRMCLSFLPPAAHFSQQLEKWAKEPEETKGFFTSFRAMSIANLTPPATRSRKSSCIVPSKDCLSNSAAAADWFDEQRFSFYRRSA